MCQFFYAKFELNMMKHSLFNKTFYTLGFMSLLCVSLYYCANYLPLSYLVRINCFLKSDCQIPLNHYRPDLDWNDFCVKTYLNASENSPCEFCYVISLEKDNQKIATQTVDKPVNDEVFRTRFTKNSTQCFDKNSSNLKINKRNKFSLLRYEIDVISSSNS